MVLRAANRLHFVIFARLNRQSGCALFLLLETSLLHTAMTVSVYSRFTQGCCDDGLAKNHPLVQQ